MDAWPLDNLFLAYIYIWQGPQQIHGHHSPPASLLTILGDGNPSLSPLYLDNPFPSNRDGVWCLLPFSQRFFTFPEDNRFCPTDRQYGIYTTRTKWLWSHNCGWNQSVDFFLLLKVRWCEWGIPRVNEGCVLISVGMAEESLGLGLWQLCVGLTTASPLKSQWFITAGNGAEGPEMQEGGHAVSEMDAYGCAIFWWGRGRECGRGRLGGSQRKE